MALTKISGDVIQTPLNVGVVTASRIDGNVNSTGVSTFSTIKVGTGITISGGIITATTFDGNAIGRINPSALNVTGVTTFQGNVFYGDGDIAYFGDGNDLLIFHNSTDSIIRDNGTGDLYIEGGNRIKLTNPTGIETYAVFNQDGASELWYDNSKKFETTTSGVTVFGNIIASSGSVGIGTTNPAEQLELFAGSERLMIGANSPSTYSRVAARNVTNTGYRGLQIDGSDLLINSNTSGNITLGVGGGSVGIGTNNPNQNLVVFNPTTTCRIRTKSTASNTGADFQQGTDGTAYLWNRDNADLRFGTNDSERVRVSAAGSFAVGTTAAISNLVTIAAPSTAWRPQLAFQNTTGSQAEAFVGSGSNAHNIWVTAGAEPSGDPDSSNWAIARSTVAAIYRQRDASHRWYTNTSLTSGNTYTPTERVRITSAGNLVVDAGGDSNDIQIISHSANSGHGIVYLRGNASNESSSIQLNHFGYADWFVSAGRVGNGEFSISNTDAGTDGIKLNTSGDLLPLADNSRDLGSTSLRWRNIYTADLQMSNEGSSNDVDGTWGKYTIQEGENDLFLINRRTGKRYKFLLEEVK